MVANETTVLVPVDNVDGVGLRRAINDEEIDRLFGLLGDGKIDNHQNWKGRFKDNSDKIRSGSIYEIADRSEEHTSELQSRLHLVCRLLLEKKKDQSARPHVREPLRNLIPTAE